MNTKNTAEDTYATHYFRRKPAERPKELDFLMTSDGRRYTHSRHSVRFSFYNEEIDRLESIAELSRKSIVAQTESIYLYPDGKIWVESRTLRERDPNRRCLSDKPKKDYEPPAIERSDLEIKNAIFDWAGTINNSMEAFYFAVEHILKVNGKEPISREQARKDMDVPYMGFWAKHCPDMSKEEQDRLYAEAMVSAPRADIYDGVAHLLRKLESNGVQLFVLSSDLPHTLLPESERYGIREIFTEISHSVHDKERGLAELLRKHSLDPSETVYIGDTAGDMRAGKASGVIPVGITWGMHPAEKLLEGGALHIIDDMSELEQKVRFVTLP